MATTVFVGSWNAGPAAAFAAAALNRGEDLLDALAGGIALVEDDPEEMSVGFGGLPNEDGEVELDAAIMDARAHRAGAVAGVRGYRHVARLALEVMRRTDHALLVGEGAARFADRLGFPRESLLTPKARQAWLAWKAGLSDRDAWVDPGAQTGTTDFGGARWAGRRDSAGNAGPDVPTTFGTIHLSALVRDGQGVRLACCTSTSGLSYKIAGRVGDSPVVGAGLYCEDGAGSAGATGRGEAVLQNCGAYEVVREMGRGTDPGEACVRVLRGIASRTRDRRLLDGEGRPGFNVTLYALRADGAVGSASMHEGYEFITNVDGVAATPASRFVYNRETGSRKG